jgi:flagellar protein FliS
MVNNGYNAYKQNQTEVTSPEKLIEMLYEGILRFASLAKKAIEEGDKEARVKWINRTSDIYVELISSLRFDGSDMPHYLNGLYIHQLKLLSSANIKNSTEELETVLHVAKTLLDTWREETQIEEAMA